MGKLDGKVAAITGAGGGIGRALAKAMAAQGAAIVANDLGTTLAGDRASASPANDVVAEIKAAGGKAAPNLMDISTMEGGKGLVDQAVKEFGKLDILVNLAGVIRDRMIFNMEEEDWDRVLDSHLKGTFCTSRFASAHMRERRYGRIINFSSNAALGSPGQPSYAAAKAGILGLTFSTAQGLRRYGITCNAIFPVAATRMTDTIHQEAFRITPSGEAQGTPFDPANVAPIVIFLASDDAAEISGQVFGSAGYTVTRYRHMSPERTLLLLHLLAQLGEAFEPNRFAEFVIDCDRRALAHLLHINRELGLLAGKLSGRIILGKGHANRAVLAGRRPDQLFFKTGDEAAGTKHDLAVLAAGTGNFPVAYPPLDIDDDDIAALGRPLDRLGFALLLGDPRDRGIDALFRHLDDQPLDAQIGKVRLRNFGQDLDQHLVFEIGAFAERHDVDLGRQRRPQIVLADRVLRAALDRALHHLAQY